MERDLLQVSRWVTSLRAASRPQELEAGGDNTPLSEAADTAHIVEERENEMQLLDWLVQRSVGLREALGRMDAETYGVCEACDQFIHPERLLALPEAALCLDCQNASDARHRSHAGRATVFAGRPVA
jgi:DnaK suppressor protein